MNIEFFSKLARTLNSAQSRSVILCGDVHDMFWNGQEYVPLIPFICQKSKIDGLIQIVYELNGPIRFQVEAEQEEMKAAYIEWKTGIPVALQGASGLSSEKRRLIEERTKDFDEQMQESIGNANLALEFMRQLTICSRDMMKKKDLLIVIEAADMLLPQGDGDIAKLNERQLQRISIVQDWFNNPAFIEGGDSVIMIAESENSIHNRVQRLPQVLSIEIPSPDLETRKHYTEHFVSTKENGLKKLSADQLKNLFGKFTTDEFARMTAGLSLFALRQLISGVAYSGKPMQIEDIIDKVEEFIKSQLGEEVVEFSRPTHKLADCVGNKKLKKFLLEEVIPRIKSTNKKIALAGAGVSGPIGGGKTFIFEAVAGELGIPVIVLKNIRSQWYGQTDVIFDRLRRLLEALDKVLLFIDEADTQFGQLSKDAHETERRLTGKMQAMMSDRRLKGKVVWLLMTARIHLLSPDIRRPGRIGDLIIPVFDPLPKSDDQSDFIRWLLEPAVENYPLEQKNTSGWDLKAQEYINLKTGKFSAGEYTSLRSNLETKKSLLNKDYLSFDEVKAIIEDALPPDIGLEREYQILQARLNCTRRSLLDGEYVPETWKKRIKELELQGIE